MRGDVPFMKENGYYYDTFSPRARGCSCFIEDYQFIGAVFPACAGMFPSGKPRLITSGCFPRVRGDVPLRQKRFQILKRVFPACAGMFLVWDL